MPDVERAPHGKRIEIATAIVLSVAGLLTSWASFQSALWHGEQAASYSRANALRVKASTAELKADTRTALEVNLFNAWLNAEASGEARLADFYRARFPLDLSGPFEAWLKADPLHNPAAPQSPFAGGQSGAAGEAAARDLNGQADAAFQAGLSAASTADAFEQSSIYFAVALFLGGITQVFDLRWLRLALLGVAIVAAGFAIIRMIGLPYLHPH